MRSIRMNWVGLFAILLGVSCDDGSGQSVVKDGPGFEVSGGNRSGTVFTTDDEILTFRQSASDPNRTALFGDLHVHTKYSFDAYVFGTLASPHDAYRFARGEAIDHPAGFEIRLKQPLDFYAVTDHAMFLGLVEAAADTTTDFSKLDVALPLNDLNAPDNMTIMSLLSRLKGFGTFIPAMVAGLRDESIDLDMVLEVTRTAWRDTIDAAELFNDPGHFTTFIAYEYTSSSDDRGNLHRNVIFKGSDRIPAIPFSRFHSQNPEGLWDWMDGLRAQGVESLAIPHNSNGSNGQMFKLVNWAGDPIDNAYAERRSRNEPLVEITQIKGTSETHPLLSSTDEWANFEIAPYRVATMQPSEPAGSYVRDALRRGLALERQGIANPYDFGVIGSSDTHNAGESFEESTYVSKLGLLSSRAKLRGSVPLNAIESLVMGIAMPSARKEVDGSSYVETATPTYGASGLAAVWAEENTRDSIYEAFRRKETFATSGPRIQLRFFAGYGFSNERLDSPDGVARAYANGVTMGGNLPAEASREPSFILWALSDALSAPLQRMQIIKGWLDKDGETFERVYDVACSSGGAVDPVSHRCPDNGASVDLSDCSYSRAEGAGQLHTHWRDPDFDPSERAFYYARVLENPTCRWSTWDALRAGVSPRSDFAVTIQERAWSSPIHYLAGGPPISDD